MTNNAEVIEKTPTGPEERPEVEGVQNIEDFAGQSKIEIDHELSATQGGLPDATSTDLELSPEERVQAEAQMRGLDTEAQVLAAATQDRLDGLRAPGKSEVQEDFNTARKVGIARVAESDADITALVARIGRNAGELAYVARGLPRVASFLGELQDGSDMRTLQRRYAAEFESLQEATARLSDESTNQNRAREEVEAITANLSKIQGKFMAAVDEKVGSIRKIANAMEEVGDSGHRQAADELRMLATRFGGIRRELENRGTVVSGFCRLYADGKEEVSEEKPGQEGASDKVDQAKGQAVPESSPAMSLQAAPKVALDQGQSVEAPSAASEVAAAAQPVIEQSPTEQPASEPVLATTVAGGQKPDATTDKNPGIEITKDDLSNPQDPPKAPLEVVLDEPTAPAKEADVDIQFAPKVGPGAAPVTETPYIEIRGLRVPLDSGWSNRSFKPGESRVETGEASQDIKQALAPLSGEIETTAKHLVTPYTKQPGTVEITLDSPSQDQSAAAQVRQGREEAWARMNSQLSQRERAAIPALLQGIRYESQHKVGEHFSQVNPYACTLASTLNILEGFDARGGLTESQLARMLGESGENRPVPIAKSTDFLRQKGFEVKNVASVSQMIQEIVDGRMIMMTIPGEVNHRVVISGMRVENGKVSFLWSDPLKGNPHWTSLYAVAERFSYDPEIPNMCESVGK